MRKLTDILSSMDQFNRMGNYSDEYKNAKEVEMQTEFPNPPDKATVSESLENSLRNILNMETYSNSYDKGMNKVSNFNIPVSYVLKFDQFIEESGCRNLPSNVRSYFGDIKEGDEDWDEEFIEEE